MGIDFSKRSERKEVEKKTHPCEIYETLVFSFIAEMVPQNGFFPL